MKKVIWALSITVFGLFLTSAVFAQNANSNNRTVDQNNKVSQINKCEAVENNLQKRIQTFETNRDRTVGKFEKVRTRLGKLVTDLEGEGYDVTTLQADLVTFEGMVEDFKTNHEAYMTALGESKNFSCGRTEGEFKAKLTTTRTRLKAVHDDSVALHAFWAKTFKSDIQALKGTLDTETVVPVEVDAEIEAETEGSL